ncbi:MAG: GtrA family protein [Campylobacterales bacterium]|nr:GtrA family protein [Campylobacterales bacterium]
MLKYSFFRYGLVGVYSVILDYILLYILYSIFGVSQNIAVTLAFFGSSVFNFLLHKNYTFKSKKSMMPELIKYIVLVVISYFITLFLIDYLVGLNINIYVAKFITVMVVYIYGYIISKLFIYNRI